MATINKQYSFIWYGKCIDTGTTNGGCTSFTLDNSGESAKIDTVWQVDELGNANAWVNGAEGTQSFSTLECGHAYYIKLKGPAYDCDIPHAELSGYSQETATAFRITEDCNAGGGGGGTVLQASIALGACQSAITLSATQLDSDDSYTSCQLQKTGATFVAISDTLTDNIRYNLTDGGLLSYKIDNTDDVGASLTTGAITITANADEGYGFGSQSNTLTVTINGSVTALPKPVINITTTVSPTNTVTFIPDFNDATNWGGTNWKYRLKNAIGQSITNYTTVTNFQSNAIDITNEFDHAGIYTIDAEIVTTGGDSIAGSTKVENQSINIPRLAANISVGNIAHGSIDRDTLPDTKTASVTATNISGDWSIKTDASNAAITATKNNNNLQSVLNTQELGVIDSDNKVTISAQGTKWNQVETAGLGGSDLVLGPASNEVTAECTITATVTDGVVFTSSKSSVSDNTRDTDDAIPSPTKITITHDDVDSWVASLNGTSTNWKFSTTQTGTYSTDPATLSKSGLDHAPGTFDFWVKYDTNSVADETLTLTLSESATDGHSDVADITITLTGEVTQAIGTAIFSGCSSIDAISIEVGDTSNSTNNNKTCDLTTTDCSVDDVTATTLGIFTYTITNNKVNYWITDASSVQSTETETLDVTAKADTNFLIDGQPTKIISITLSGTVNAKTATASITTNPSGVGSVTFGEDYSSQTDTFKITTNANANITIPATTALPITQGDFEITDIAESGGVYTYTYKIKAGVSTGAKSATYGVTVNADTNSQFDGLAINASKTINVTLSGTVEAATIPENSSIANGACPKDISQDASTTATQTSCQLTLVNAVCVPITNAVHGGLKYSLTAQGLLTYEANDPESVGEHSHEVTITANSTDSSASLFAGQAQTVTHKVTMKITVNEVVVADDKLWIGFAKDASTFYSWYELEAVEELTTQIQFDNMATFTQFSAMAPPAETPAVGENFNSATMNIMGSIYPINTANLPGGVVITDLNGLEIKGTADAMYVDLVSTLDHTQFKFQDEDFYTSLMTEIGTAGQLAYTMITASPTEPNSSSLTTSQKTNSYNNDFLRLKCGTTWNGDQVDGTKKAILKAKFDSSDDGSDTIATASYTAQVSTNALLTSGNWSGCNAIFASGQFNDSNGNRPRIKHFYFETQSGATLLKFSDSGTAQPQC